MPSTGGARKIRWTSNINQGKRGGTKVIYYYHNQEMPIFLFTGYAKNQKADLSMSERNSLHKVIKLIVESWEDNYE